MELKFSKGGIEFKRELSSLDKFVIEFTSVLNKANVKYVVVSGYVSILFGRNRTSEDVDMIIENMDFSKFKLLCDKLGESFGCLNTTDLRQAYQEYISADHALRFSRKKEFIPNFELKFPKTPLDVLTLEKRRKVVFNGKILYISPLELQISFKVFLGSEKDIEDARYLYKIFKENLDIRLINEFNQKLKIVDRFNKHIK